MGDCCYKYFKDNNQINIIKQKRGISNPNYFQKKKENKFSYNSSINNGSIKRENSLDSKKLNNNLQGNYNQKKKNKLKSEKESEKKINNIIHICHVQPKCCQNLQNSYMTSGSIKYFIKGKTELPKIGNQHYLKKESQIRNPYYQKKEEQPIKLFEKDKFGGIKNNISDKYSNSCNINNIEKKLNANNSSNNSSYLSNKNNSNSNIKKSNNISLIKDNQNEKDKNSDKQSKKSNVKRNISSDSKNYNNYNIDYNNNKDKEIKNSNEKENIKNKHVSVNKYNLKEEKLRKSYQKYEIDCDNIEKASTISTKPKGLYNLGLSCYMNSLLQCLFYIKELRAYFINEKDNFKNNQVVCKALSEVMYGLKYDPKDYFEAKQFKKEMGNKNSLFFGVKAGDAKDLFINLIDSILTETTIDNDDQCSNGSIDLTDKNQVFQEMYKEVDMNNIINKLFIGFYETKYKCKKNPKDFIYSFSSESFISFNLEKASNHFRNNYVTIENCFEYNYDRTYTTSFHCSKCNKTENNSANDIIYIPPEILVIVLDRGKGKSFKGNVLIDINLDLKCFIDHEKVQNNTKYKLIGVSTHSGTSSSSGHYTACCLTDNGKYYYFSDTYVHEINESKLFENEPYLLFYKRI